jgi:hypothetical protein
MSEEKKDIPMPLVIKNSKGEIIFGINSEGEVLYHYRGELKTSKRSKDIALALALGLKEVCLISQSHNSKSDE